MNLHFISGLPRSGSTLLCNVLAQNPRFYASQTSGLLDVLFNVRNQWSQLIEMRSMDQSLSAQRQKATMRAMIDGFYADVLLPVIFDKSRGWLAHIEMIEALVDQPVRILVPVRDLRDVLASFEKLHRKTASFSQPGAEAAGYLMAQTVEQRCAYWTRHDQPVGLAYNRIKDALQRGHGGKLFFVDYDAFCKEPRGVLQNAYEFLEEPWYNGHDFANVQQVTWEDDTVHGVAPGALHGIRQNIKPQPPQWPSVLGKETASKYAGLELWK